GTLYVGSGAYGDTTNYFYAINPDGEIKWKFSTGNPGMIESGYLINNEGTIFFGSQSGWLYALDSNENLKWKFNTGSNIYQQVMNIDLNGSIYIADASNYLYSVSKNGESNWKVNYGGGLGARSVAFSPDGNTMYTAKDSNIFALNLDGSIKWIFECPGIRRLPLTVDNSGNLYFIPGCSGGLLSLISIDSSKNIRWEHFIENPRASFFASSPAIDYQGNIYFAYTADSGATRYGRIESVDHYGNYRWTYQFEQPGEDIDMPLVVDKDGTVYCGSTWGYNYYAVSNRGELLWQIPLNGGYVENSTAIDSDGTLYVGRRNQLAKTLIAIKDTGTVSVNEPSVALLDYKLLQNHPNPLNPTTTINYQLKENGLVTLKLYNVLGEEIKTLVNEEKTKGRYIYNFDGSDLATGVYIYHLRVNDFISSKKLMLLK
ncbi:MAG: hypothetical protein A2006_02695, partial [Ignavibacteria bacterium GWC2_35_8]